MQTAEQGIGNVCACGNTMRTQRQPREGSSSPARFSATQGVVSQGLTRHIVVGWPGARAVLPTGIFPAHDSSVYKECAWIRLSQKYREECDDSA